MEQRPPQQVLKSLIEGVDPATGAALPSGSVLRQPGVQHALLAGIAALEADTSRAQRRTPLPENLGQPWSQAEEQQLAAAFKAGQPLTEIAGRHGRSLTAIEARLERLGLLTPEQRITRNRYSPQKPASSLEKT